MKKLHLILVQFLTVLALTLLVASCGGGGGGGGSDYSEPAASPSRSENSVLDIKAPTYVDKDLHLKNSPTGNSFAAGTSVTFTADSGYESYMWLVNSETLQSGEENTFTLDTSTLSGPVQLTVFVTDADGFYSSDDKNFIVTVAD